MKKTLNDMMTGLAVLLIACMAVSCKKDSTAPAQQPASFTLVNALPGASALVPNFFANNKLVYYRVAQQIAANASFEFGEYLGNYSLSISQLTDTTHTVFNGGISLPSGSFHTLIVCGTLASPDTVFANDNIKPITDSVVNVRFINASAGSSPVNINISGSQATPVVTSLPYKGKSAFLPFTAKSAAPAYGNYVFEIRDAATSKLLTSYNMASASTVVKTFKNFTIVFKGLPGGTGANAPGTILVNNF